MTAAVGIFLWLLVCGGVFTLWVIGKLMAQLASWRPKPREAAREPDALPPAPPTKAEKVQAALAEYAEDLALCEAVPDNATRSRMKAAAAEKLRRKLAEAMR